MTFIKIDPDRVDAVAGHLDDRADAVEEERKNISRASADNHDPVESVVTATEALPGFLAPSSGSQSFGGVSQGLRSLADELRARSQEARDLNSSGITMQNPDGSPSYCYYLPDPPAGTADVEAYWNATDTVATVREYNSQSVQNARSESAELVEALNSADGRASSGRTVDEILTETAKHQDVPTYGAAYVSAVGVETYLDLVEKFGARHTTYTPSDTPPVNMATKEFDAEGAAADVGVLGHIFAAASQPDVTICDSNGQPLDLVDEVESAVEEDGERGRMTALNGLLETQGTVYGTEFLVDLAGRFEDNPYDASSSGLEPKYGGAYEGSSMDPLYGVCMAMSNNPEAALTYFTPDGGTGERPGEQSAERWKLLTERTWDPNVGLDSLTGAVAAASAYRNTSDSTVPQADARATWLVGQAIPYFAQDDEPEKTETMKENLAVVIGNSGEEFSAIAYGEVIEDNVNDLGLEGYVSTADFESLVYDVIDNENAAGTMAAGMGQYHHGQIEAIVTGSDNPSTGLRDQYQRVAATMGYLEAVATRRAGDDEAAKQEAKGNVSTALSVFSTVLASGVSAVTGGTSLAVAGPLLYGVGSTVAQPIIVDEVTEDWDVPDTVEADDIQNVLHAQSYVDAARYDTLQSSTIAIGENIPTYGGTEPLCSVVDGRVVVNAPDPMTPDAAAYILGWRTAVTNSGSSDQQMVDLDEAVQAGWTKGAEQGKEGGE